MGQCGKLNTECAVKSFDSKHGVRAAQYMQSALVRGWRTLTVCGWQAHSLKMLYSAASCCISYVMASENMKM